MYCGPFVRSSYNAEAVMEQKQEGTNDRWKMKVDDKIRCLSIDNAILMHRDAHFGGRLQPSMLDYYRAERKRRSIQEFNFKRIETLQQTETKGGKNLVTYNFIRGRSGKSGARLSRRIAYCAPFVQQQIANRMASLNCGPDFMRKRRSGKSMFRRLSGLKKALLSFLID